ncbi:AtpZ/AtpI family protein [Pedobacter alpinus]|uniref:AtpZ/AtpI family protein n=1 Tax=Pedobacter alpinus TaxID=1590643 RepID=A0ABW5TNR2_9SPHI
MNQEKEPFKKEKQQLNTYAKYSAIGFQMIGIIGVFAFAGYKIDEYQNTKTPIYTGILSLIGVFISIYIVIKSLK